MSDIEPWQPMRRLNVYNSTAKVPFNGYSDLCGSLSSWISHYVDLLPWR